MTTTTIDTENHDDIGKSCPPIQVLIAACGTADEHEDRYAWLHGYCVLTITPRDYSVDVTGEVRVAERYAHNPFLVRKLAAVLDPAFVLAGFDLDATINQLGRLPIGTDVPEDALAMLDKLQASVETWLPLDVGCDQQGQDVVYKEAQKHGLLVDKEPNPYDLEEVALVLAKKAGAVALAVGQLHMPARMQPQLLAAWKRWYTSHMPMLPRLTLATSEGEAVA